MHRNPLRGHGDAIVIQKMTNRKINNAIRDRNLVSYMNETKWRELFNGVKSNDLEMPFRNKSILVEEHSIASMDITLMEHDGYSNIEWVDFRSKKRVNGEDLSTRTIEYLSKFNIPHSVHKDYVRVWGYVEPDNSENIV